MRLAHWTMLLFPFLATAQDRVQGRVFDAIDHQPLQYVSIGAVPQGAVTMSRVDGSFLLEVPTGQRIDSVRFLLVGHAERTVPVGSLQNGGEVSLAPDALELAPAEVVGARREERELGNRSHHLLFNYLLKEEAPGEVIELAQAIDLGPVAVAIAAVNLYVSGSPMDSATFRVGFRGFDGDRPTGPLVHRSVIRRVAVKEGWLRIDIASERIRLQGRVALTVELLPDEGQVLRWMSVGIRLGGGLPGFDRRSGFAEWAQMPHRYSVNVSALVPQDRPADAPEDPDPYQRAVELQLWSPVVKDSFAIAFGLPEDFDPSRAGGYATLYLLDANVYFNDVVDLVHELTRKRRIPPTIVVGIGYRDVMLMDSLRIRDDLLVRADSLPGSGGGGHFLSFLADELVPLVRERFPVDAAHSALMGHSLGGHLVLFAFIERGLHGEMPFNTFIAASPSVDVADGAVLHALEGLASEVPTTGCAVFISHGRSEDDVAMRSCVGLVRRCSAQGVEEQHYPGADHMGTALPSFRDGLSRLWGTE